MQSLEFFFKKIFLSSTGFDLRTFRMQKQEYNTELQRRYVKYQLLKEILKSFENSLQSTKSFYDSEFNGIFQFFQKSLVGFEKYLFTL